MPGQSLFDLIMQSVLQEHNNQLEQHTLHRVEVFAKLIQDKNREELFNIKLHILDRLQHHYKNPDIVKVCFQAITLLDKQIRKLEN